MRKTDGDGLADDEGGWLVVMGWLRAVSSAVPPPSPSCPPCHRWQQLGAAADAAGTVRQVAADRPGCCYGCCRKYSTADDNALCRRR